MAPGPTGRQQLITAVAHDLFTQHGYNGTTIAEIAAALDTSKAAIAYYFPAKEDLPRAIVTPLLDQLEHDINGPTPQPDWPEHQLKLLAAYLDRLIEHRAVAIWLDSDQWLINHTDYGNRLRHINDTLINHITTDDHGEAARARALAVIGGIWRPLRELDPTQLARQRGEVVQAALVSYAPLQHN